MKKFLISLFIFCSLFSSAQNPLVKMWDHRFGGTDKDWLHSLIQTNDGGYILGGESFSGLSGDKTQEVWGSSGGVDYWIVKTDSLGNKQWDKDFGGLNGDWFFDIHQTNDEGYILGGLSLSGIGGDKTQPNWGNEDYWVVKTDSLGNKQWDKDFGGTGLDQLNSLQQTLDGGYILCGYSSSNDNGDKTQPNWDSSLSTCDFWIVKIDSLGSKQWDKVLGGASSEFYPKIVITSDSGYILGGWSASGISGDKTENSLGGLDYWIIKIDSLGNKEWDKDFGGTEADVFSTLNQTSDGGFILGGSSNSGIGGDKTQNSWGGTDYWVLKINSFGEKEWDRDYGGADQDELYQVSQTQDGGYLFSGDSYSQISGDKSENNLGVEQTWVVKVDSSGNKQWEKTIFTPGHDENGSAIQTWDGCYAIANYSYQGSGIGGYKTQTEWGNSDYWIVKFCDSTHIGINELSRSNSVSIYPSPAATEIFISSFTKISEIKIFDLIGKELLSQNISNNKKEIDIHSFSSGIYFLQLQTAQGTIVKKFIKE